MYRTAVDSKIFAVRIRVEGSAGSEAERIEMKCIQAGNIGAGNIGAEIVEAEIIECNGSRITGTTTGYASLPGLQYLQLMVPDTMLVLLTVDMVFDSHSGAQLSAHSSTICPSFKICSASSFAARGGRRPLCRWDEPKRSARGWWIQCD
jgi:hypothetical protein